MEQQLPQEPKDEDAIKPVREAPRAPRTSTESAFAKLRLWQETASYSVIAFAVATGLAVLGWNYVHSPGWEERTGFFRRGPKVEEVVTVPEAPTMRRALDGVRVPEGTPEPTDYVAVMIDNIAEAWPQSGVAAAPLVFEAPVEGGITRLMAVFPSDAVFPQLGPVRSARPYYLDWAEEFGALYVHVGGSPEALEKLKASDLRDLNEFFAGKHFWRDGKRYAPHNTYVSSATLAAALETRPRVASAIEPWKYKDDMLPDERPSEPFAATVGEQGKWRVTWRYDREANSFVRVLPDGPQVDADGTAVLAKNVMVQFTTVRVLDEVGRRRVDTFGQGEAVVLMDGHAIGGTWNKEAGSGRTRFHDAAGNELSINAGVTWVEVVPLGTPVTY